MGSFTALVQSNPTVKYSEVVMSQRVVTSLQEAHDSLQPPLSQPKVTYKRLSDAIAAFWREVLLTASSIPGATLVDILHGSFRLTQWAKINDSLYRIWTQDQTACVEVTPEKICVCRGPQSLDLQSGLPAATLYDTIQKAQAIVQPAQPTAMSEEEQAEFFEPDPSAEAPDLDAALADSPANVEGEVLEDEAAAELMEDITVEGALNDDQRREDGPKPIVTVSQQFISDISEPKEERAEALASSYYTAKANQKNAATDGVICSYCGNLNRSAYKGTCPKCPRVPSGEGARQAALIAKDLNKAAEQPGRDPASESFLMARLKSLQGRVLTIVDASPIADKAQRDAVKSLINKEFRREMNKASDGGWRANDPRYEE